MQHEGDERQPTPTVLAAVHEARHRLAHLRCRLVPDEAARLRKNVALAQGVDLGTELFCASAETGRKAFKIQNGLRVTVEEDKDVPGQERANVIVHELHDGRSQDSFEVVQDKPFHDARLDVSTGHD